mmetsp:Transcript_2679/g.3632  ORF Transcript_2679/g.3632 Transcript_2679/m.3632 type:complete len:423 (+) Transcript_2679:308-1576(+)
MVGIMNTGTSSQHIVQRSGNTISSAPNLTELVEEELAPLINDKKEQLASATTSTRKYHTFDMSSPPNEIDDEHTAEKIKNLRLRRRGVSLADGPRFVKLYPDCLHLRVAATGRNDYNEGGGERKRLNKTMTMTKNNKQGGAVEAGRGSGATGQGRSRDVDTTAAQNEEKEDAKKEQKRKNGVGEKDAADVFVVSWGVVVMWNTNEKATQTVRRMVRQFQVGRIKGAEDIETEDMDYVFGGRRSVKGDLITLSLEKEGEDAVHEKLAATLALAQSLKLSVLETRLQKQFEEVKHLPRELAKHGQIASLSRKGVQKLLGRLFITHTDLTLTSDLLDTPEFFWEEDANLPFYKTMFSYLEIPKRTSTFNKRKDVLHELYEVIRDSKESQYSDRLEWIIIWLILVEVILELVQILVGYYHYFHYDD